MADVIAFLRTKSCDGDGSGYENGDGSGSCFGFGYGSGEGSGFGYGDGSGSGSGSGRGTGSGYGSGSGSGYGSGFGDCDGDGSGYGRGRGIKALNGEPVYLVDDLETIIRRVHGNVAKGAVLGSDLTLAPCYIVRQDNTFAHGRTLREAMEALRDKLFEDMDEDERIAAFVREHEWGKQYPDTDFFAWHHRLTGSCEMGRNAFARDRGLEKLDGAHTVEWFIELTKNAYGGEVIRKLKAAYGRG